MYGWEFPPNNSGGLGTACYGLARALVREGADVTFVLPKKYPVLYTGAKMVFADDEVPLSAKEAQVFTSGYLSEEQMRFLKGAFPNVQYGPSLFDEVLQYASRSAELAKTHGADVIHAHDWLCYPAGIAAKRALGVPLVVHVHATEFDRTGFGSMNEQVSAIERQGMHEADQVVTVSDYTKQVVVSQYGVSPEKVTVVHNGIDDDDSAILRATEDTMARVRSLGWKVVLFVGRITVQKGPDYFLEAAQRVLSVRPNTLFVVSGSGDMAQQMMHRAAYLGIGDKVLFTGFLRNQALARLYASADLLVMPSVSEPFGIVPLEALLNGTPVLISKQSGVAEVIRNSLKADFWDIEDMAHKIMSVLSYPALQHALREQGAREARTRVWKKVAERCMLVYKKLGALVSSI